MVTGFAPLPKADIIMSATAWTTPLLFRAVDMPMAPPRTQMVFQSRDLKALSKEMQPVSMHSAAAMAPTVPKENTPAVKPATQPSMMRQTVIHLALLRTCPPSPEGAGSSTSGKSKTFFCRRMPMNR